MNREVFLACLPWLAIVILAVLAARLLVTLSGARLNLSRLGSLHSNESGSVQTLSFVLTLPFFALIIMLIVQASQIMLGNILVHYAAYATARSAIVWIPAVYETEGTNQISSMTLIERNDVGHTRFRITPDLTSPKFSKIQSAAVLACTPMGPSRDLGYALPPGGDVLRLALANVHQALSNSPETFERRIGNKLAYALSNTAVELTFWHRQNTDERYKEPPLQQVYELPPDIFQFAPNELGWQDHLTAEVTFNLPLLPGPVRLFAPQARSNSEPATDQTGQVYVWRLSAMASLGIEGDKPQIEYIQEPNQ